MKATAVAPSNLAFVKYWGKKDEVLRIPLNGSISMNLSGLLTTTTVDFDPKLKSDTFSLNGKSEDAKKVSAHLDRIRKLAKIKDYARVGSENNFPASTGLSSSASGFAALTVAGSAAAGLRLSEKELSILARQGSGSACRSIPDGFVEWIPGKDNSTSYAKSIFSEDHWNTFDVTAIVSTEKKAIPTSEGQKRESAFLKARVQGIDDKLKRARKAIKEKDFTALGELCEEEALELHAIMLTSRPYLLYLQPNTISLMKKVIDWRQEGLECYFSLNTGQDVHILVEEKDKQRLKDKLNMLGYVSKVIESRPCKGAHLI